MYWGWTHDIMSKFRMPTSLDNSPLRNLNILGMFPTKMQNFGPFQPCCSMVFRNFRGVHQNLVTKEWTLWQTTIVIKVEIVTSASIHHIETPWNNSTTIPILKVLRFLTMDIVCTNPCQNPRGCGSIMVEKCVTSLASFFSWLCHIFGNICVMLSLCLESLDACTKGSWVFVPNDDL
jgi:hypothetical protein